MTKRYMNRGSTAFPLPKDQLSRLFLGEFQSVSFKEDSN